MREVHSYQYLYPSKIPMLKSYPEVGRIKPLYLEIGFAEVIKVK